ncbi:MAG: FtsX-like permease family protein [Pseudomonadota bacterium]
MNRFRWTLATLIGHWRRRPGQALTLAVGLALATALWSGVQALNAQAKTSYDKAAAMLGGPTTPILLSRSASRFGQEEHVALRRAGWKVSPVLEGRVRVNEARLRLLGIDPVTLPATAMVFAAEEGEEDGPDFVEFLTPPGVAFIAPETMARLGLSPGDRAVAEDGTVLPPLEPRSTLADGVIVVDIGVAQGLLDAPGLVSRLLIDPDAQPGTAPIVEVTGDRLRRIEPQETGDLERLTESFHLNLTAFGFLSFFVGLFIVHGAIGLAFEQRRSMFRTLRACGVSARGLAVTLLAELLAIAVLAGLAGTALGYLMAAALLPDVAASLRGLYGAPVAGELSLRPSWWLLGIAISALGALVAAAGSLWRAYRLPILAAAQPYAWQEAQRAWLRGQGALAGGVLLVGAVALVFGDGLIAGFAVMAALLIGAALLLPSVLSAALRLGEAQSQGAVARWFWADSRQQLSGLSLALMALLLALAVNIGVGTMVGSFRTTFLGWLDQRLAAEIYFDATDAAQAEEITDWLAAEPAVTAILPSWDNDTRIGGWPAEVRGYADHATYRETWPMLEALPDAWDRVFGGGAVLMSEQLARRLDRTVGDGLDLRGETGDWHAEIVGIYPDYGNPNGQLFVSADTLTRHWPSTERTGFSLRVDPGETDALVERMVARFDLGPTRIIDQGSLKAESRRIFENTFAVTSALNVFTLAVAAVALLTSLTTLGALRLPQLAPLWAMGVTRRRLALIELGKTLSLAFFTAVVALPLGLLVAWCLVDVINVHAFGWRLPLTVFPVDWLRLAVLAVVAAGLAAAIPVIRLRRTPPAQLVKVFADER